MSTIAAKPATTPIPVQLSDSEFSPLYLPALDAQARAEVQLGYHRVFNLILWLLYTGMQWAYPCRQTPMGTAHSLHDRVQSLYEMGR